MYWLYIRHRYNTYFLVGSQVNSRIVKDQFAIINCECDSCCFWKYLIRQLLGGGIWSNIFTKNKNNIYTHVFNYMITQDLIRSLVARIEDGGINVSHFATMIETNIILWIKRLLNNSGAKWKCIFGKIIKPFTIQDFVENILDQESIDAIEIPFHKQLFEIWISIKKKPRNKQEIMEQITCIWKNRYIQLPDWSKKKRTKAIFWPKLYEAGIGLLKVKDLFTPEGAPINFRTLSPGVQCPVDPQPWGTVSRGPSALGYSVLWTLSPGVQCPVDPQPWGTVSCGPSALGYSVRGPSALGYSVPWTLSPGVQCPVDPQPWGTVSCGPSALGYSVPWTLSPGVQCPVDPQPWGTVSCGPSALGYSVLWTLSPGVQCPVDPQPWGTVSCGHCTLRDMCLRWG